jgi:hypothetical protein
LSKQGSTVKKLAIAALSLGLFGAAQAAPVTIDAGTFELTYRDEYMVGLTLSYANGVFTFSGEGLTASAVGGINEYDFSVLPLDSYNGKPFPILLTPKAGYQISGVTESVLGTYSATAGQGEESSAGVTAGLVSRWVYQNGADMLGQNAPYTIAALLTGGEGSAQGAFIATGYLDFQPVLASLNLAPGTIALSALDGIVAAGAFGQGSHASGNLTAYRLGVAVTAVPEPEALGMLLAGLGVVGFSLARRRTAR